MKSINIGSVKIGEDSPPYIIAELSGNHNNNIDTDRNQRKKT